MSESSDEKGQFSCAEPSRVELSPDGGGYVTWRSRSKVEEEKLGAEWQILVFRNLHLEHGEFSTLAPDVSL